MVELRLAGARGVAVVDDADAERLPATGWSLQSNGYVHHHAVDGETLLHRIVMRPPKDMDVDHINHDKRDCRRVNLRVVTRAQNNQNRQGPMSTNRLGIRGVSWQRKKNGLVTFFARVQVDGRVFHRCGFRTAEEAEAAAIALRRMHFTHSQECS